MVWALIGGPDGCYDAGGGFTYSYDGREVVWVSPPCVWGVAVLLAAVSVVLDYELVGGRVQRPTV